MQCINRKLAERHSKATILYKLVMWLRARKYNGSPNDKIVNPIAVDTRGKTPAYTTIAEKRALYNAGVDCGDIAYAENGSKHPLGMPGTGFNDVEFIAGYWRIQNKFEQKITCVRDKEFVIGDKLPHKEHTNFEFYNAFPVYNNCYGRFIFTKPDYIVAKFETARGPYWAYGQTIDQARAYLGIKLCDEYGDIIRAELGRENSK